LAVGRERTVQAGQIDGSGGTASSIGHPRIRVHIVWGIAPDMPYRGSAKPPNRHAECPEAFANRSAERRIADSPDRPGPERPVRRLGRDGEFGAGREGSNNPILTVPGPYMRAWG
jgi:hypothetical protein